ncbi:DUF262 domain-containing protein [Gordonia alkanivorans]|uniref:DUF262 domain-containing protein n=1 Tax=Gordonia alkanivorans TaxID=84096 RepID=UPI002447E1B4|nr:DUF262 domain-containing HNH endonuclease family protein [Gordonia alkanivorans]MDH3022636.1 DUF262 domain-containing HNH endonuclease family protein [Gordonia alkanivorans]MDH3026867.1 DUF262 domain-containing HNH endonuclease family protein [Gordonia alkanivorans]MDJ0010283.1 DUF262 domain-containing HNH endonuclease family protein [Gordonia alkanivorans]MDJ0100124.1 DUF262 domain-containing HNH endonuclease family protein [Gordonia alkanivorans]MDJ0495916.1 DUF262 domain-containing HNH e
MIKSATQYPVHSLISHDANTLYHVPPYQREYSWQKQQWEELFDDLAESEGPHFLGTIICLNATHDAVEANILELVDGQQRMTTITLLLAAIHSILSQNKVVLDDEAQADLINLRRQLVRKQDNKLRLRPQLQGSNRADYAAVMKEAGLPVEHDHVNYLHLRRIWRCYNHFLGEIEEYAADQQIARVGAAQQILDAVNRAIIVKIEVDTHADAFVLFESLNNRGMPLTPVDLIKNRVLADAERLQVMDVEKTFEKWNEMLSNLGDDYANQERFLRHYYNAFKSSLPSVPNATVATRSKLIRIYETLVSSGVSAFIDAIVPASEIYGRITGQIPRGESLDVKLTALGRAQGAPSYMLLLYLLREAASKKTPTSEIESIVELLTAFFVRRNLTGFPQTYALPRIFMDVIDLLADHQSEGAAQIVAKALREQSASDDTFRERLLGPVYEDNADVTRFLLTSLAERGMTKETKQDLWARDKKNSYYIWTIEHILPQGKNLPDSWKTMLGGDAAATEAQDSHVHQLGNLTITGYNTSLGNKSFSEKKDRKDANGNYIGYRNGIRLNEDVVSEDEWTVAFIEKRTLSLAEQVLKAFPLAISDQGLNR